MNQVSAFSLASIRAKKEESTKGIVKEGSLTNRVVYRN
jgi:hypothetical protein